MAESSGRPGLKARMRRAALKTAARARLSELSVARRAKSFRYALEGVGWLLRTQPNAWIHAVATVAVVVVGLALGLDRIEWAIVVLTVALVWFTEAMNTAFEYLCDAVRPEFHPLVKRCKDVAAGAVLITAICATLTGALVFVPKFWALVVG